MIRWYDTNIFTSQFQSAVIYVNIPYPHQLVCQDEVTTYVDDRSTNTVRPATPYMLSLWSENPRGTPPGSPAVHSVKCDVYNIGGVRIYTVTLPYIYGRAWYRVYFRDEKNNVITGNVAVTITDGQNIFYASYPGASVHLPARPANYDVVLEFAAQKNSSKYYYIAKNPPLYEYTLVTLYPSNRFHIRVVVDLSKVLQLQDVPVIGDAVKFWMWLQAKIANYAFMVASWFSNSIGLRVPIVRAEINTDRNELVLYYENDPVPIWAIVVLGLIAGTVVISLVLSIKEIMVSETSYKTTELVTKLQSQYYNLVGKLIEFSGTTQDPAGTLAKLLPLLQPPNLPYTVGNDLNNTKSELENLKGLLYVGIGGAVLITVLSMARK